MHRQTTSAIVICCALVAVARAQDPPRFRSGVEVVVLDVSVVDKTGKPVSGLAPADFRVTVDGKERRVVSAQFVNYLDSTRTLSAIPSSSPSSPSAAVPAVHSPPGRNVLILFEEDSIETADGLMARRAAEALLAGLSPLDRVGVNLIPRLRSNFAMTTDRAENRKVLNSWVPGAYSEPPRPFNIGVAEAIEIAGMDNVTLDKVAARECRNTPLNSCRRTIVDESRDIVRQSSQRATLNLEALKQLAHDFHKLPGPKTFVLVSGGINKPESHSVYESMAKEFAASQISLYTIFLEKSEYNVARKRMTPTQADDDRLAEFHLGNTTSVVGGTFLRAIGTIEPYFQRIALELSAEYLLGIEVGGSDRDGNAHRVTIQVNRKGLEVRGRKQYVIPPIK